jgi:hypothetical protein
VSGGRFLAWSGFEAIPGPAPLFHPGATVAALVGVAGFDVAVAALGTDGRLWYGGRRHGAWSGFVAVGGDFQTDALICAAVAGSPLAAWAARREHHLGDKPRGAQPWPFAAEPNLGLLYAVDPGGTLCVNATWWDGGGGRWRPVALRTDRAGRLGFWAGPAPAGPRSGGRTPERGPGLRPFMPASLLRAPPPRAEVHEVLGDGEPATEAVGPAFAFAAAPAVGEGVHLIVVGEDRRPWQAFVGAAPTPADLVWRSFGAGFRAKAPLAAATLTQGGAPAETWVFAVDDDGRLRGAHARHAPRRARVPRRDPAETVYAQTQAHAHA